MPAANLKTFSLVFYLTVFVLGGLLFLAGFFPFTSSSHTVDDTDAGRPTNVAGIPLTPPKRLYKQILLMLVDALPYDFVTPARMPFAMDLACHKFKLRTSIPTVTMPRIKSIVSGSVSNFVDILLNLGQAEKLQHSILHNLKSNGDLIDFVGDRTWAELFPEYFNRKLANDDSFFVKDFYKGDANVTLFFENNIHKEDWTLFIMHFLGLDHIGHVEGSNSSKIIDKLKEMDDVVRKAYAKKVSKENLVLVTGDHGMRNGGGHGGSSPEEINVPLLVFKHKCPNKAKNLANVVEYNQIDISATLAALWSLEIPSTSIGCLIPEMLEELQLRDQLYYYYYNTLHLIRKCSTHDTEASYHRRFEAANAAFQEFLETERTRNVSSIYHYASAKETYTRLSKELSSSLALDVVHYDYPLIVVGITLTTLTVVYLAILTLKNSGPMEQRPDIDILQKLVSRKSKHLALTTMVLLCLLWSSIAFVSKLSFVFKVFLMLPIALGLYVGLKIIFSLPKRSKLTFFELLAISKWPLLPQLWAVLLFHTVSLASSSFIEEEQQTWYYLGATIVMSVAVGKLYYNMKFSLLQFTNDYDMLSRAKKEAFKTVNSFSLLTAVGLLRKLNQTGDKWRHLKDFGDFLNEDRNKVLLSLFFLVGILFLLKFILTHICKDKAFAKVASCLAATAIYCYRGATERNITFYNILPDHSNVYVFFFWLCIAFIAVLYLIDSRKTHVDILKRNLVCVVLICALLHKPHNVILLPAMLYILQEIYKFCDILERDSHARLASKFQKYCLICKALLTVIIAKMFYFYQGNSNSFSTIDLNPGFIGLLSYVPSIAFCLVTLNTFSSHIVALQFLILHLLAKEKGERPDAEPVGSAEPMDNDYFFAALVYAMGFLLPTAVYFILLVMFRYHLFIYSVFSPKAIYEFCAFVAFYVHFLYICVSLKLKL